MQKLFIPSLGTELKLAQDWYFVLHDEHRNATLVELLTAKGLLGPRKLANEEDAGEPWAEYCFDARLQAGATLKLDRIYIRKNQEDFDSVTFHLKGAKVPGRTEVRKGVSIGAGGREEFSYERKIPSRGVRFWVRLDDANKIHFE